MKPSELPKELYQVARLAAEGLVDKEIAAELRVTLRTVTNRLHYARTRLGGITRIGLAHAVHIEDTEEMRDAIAVHIVALEKIQSLAEERCGTFAEHIGLLVEKALREGKGGGCGLDSLS